ncbi:hypothetical protein, variant [Phialophora macrospora]|uniref:Zn(2)-C6 fungal-type domain-containing protein n=1 Tax=Phialophora macrospora TaxID=1851006 RepID=A0A0D2FMK4_9EURO|nr:hypothetical protein PV04_05268 [Phialophora macrospora]KIW69389.1 hypothetical protein, variant [Phialophora macrospora]
MPGRKPHKKSKTGCYNCKRRRIKCDESGPPCSSCTVHQDDCTYPSTRLAPPPPRPQVCACQHEYFNHDLWSNRCTPPAPYSNPQPNILELELWHKWTSNTYRHFTNNKQNGSGHNWQVLVPQLALKCDYLRNAILAISAMHIVLESPNPLPSPPSHYMLAALEYHNAACQAFGNVGGHTILQTDNDAETGFTTIFAFSVINLAFILGMSQFQVTTNQAVEESTKIVGNITMLFRVLQSMGSVISSDLDGFSRGPLPVTLDVFSESRRRRLDEATEVALTRLRCIIDREKGSQEAPDVKDAYWRAMAWLEKCFSFYSDENRDVALIWPMVLDTWFVRALETSADNVCCLILLHWAVMLHRFGRGKRFTGNLGAKLVDELSKPMLGKDSLWEESIHFVRQQVGLP